MYKRQVATRVSAAQAQAVQTLLPAAIYHPTPRILTLGMAPSVPQSGPFVAVATAGTSDLPVATEASLLLELWGQRVIAINDIGVAGMHRLLGTRCLLYTSPNPPDPPRSRMPSFP